MNQIREVENEIIDDCKNDIDREARQREAMEECAAYMAKMIKKYGREVLAEIEEEKNK